LAESALNANVSQDVTHLSAFLDTPCPYHGKDLSGMAIKLATTNLSTTLDAVAVKNELVDIESSDKSKPPSQQAARYEAKMRSLGKPMCNWQFKKCYLLQWPPIDVNS
jgi:hypothetical protein